MAVIWDMDGVMADTAAYHFAAWKESFDRRGIDFTEEDFRHSFGQRNDTIIHDIVSNMPDAEMEELSLEKEADYRRRIAGDIKPLPGVSGLLEALTRSGFRQAIASSAPLENVRQILASLGLGDHLQATISAQDVTEGKPSPQVFLLAARRLGVDPSACVVIEDAVAGVAAARNAGMRCVAVTNTHSRESLGEADLVVDSLEEVTAEDLAALIGGAREDV
jgi:beta-phosphoglucomutase family hydrolase